VFSKAQAMINEAVVGGIIENPHNQLREALACVLAFGRCFMAGPSGTGKTHAATQIAAILGREFQFAPCDGDASKFDLLGMTTATGAWEDKPVGKAWREGHVCLLDELDKAPAHATCSLNAIVNFDNRVALGDAMVDRHDGFALIATGNSSMEGPTGAYATERQSADFVARWEQLGVMVHFDYCPEVERNMLGDWASEHDLLAKARENLKAEQIDPRRTIQCRTMEGWSMWRSNGLSVGETVGRLCRLWQETEVRKVWQHLPAAELKKAIGMLGSW
jgi:MoxR-like ATPase